MARKKNPYDTKGKMKNISGSLWRYRDFDIEILRDHPYYKAVPTFVGPGDGPYLGLEQGWVANQDLTDLLELTRLLIDRAYYRESLPKGLVDERSFTFLRSEIRQQFIGIAFPTDTDRPKKVTRAALARAVEQGLKKPPSGPRGKMVKTRYRQAHDFYNKLSVKDRLALLETEMKIVQLEEGLPIATNPRKKAKKKSEDSKKYTVKISRGKHAGTTRTYKSRKAASRACDRLDLEYGAICSSVVLPVATNPPKKAKKKTAKKKNPDPKENEIIKGWAVRDYSPRGQLAILTKGELLGYEGHGAYEIPIYAQEAYLEIAKGTAKLYDCDEDGVCNVLRATIKLSPAGRARSLDAKTKLHEWVLEAIEWAESQPAPDTTVIRRKRMRKQATNPRKKAKKKVSRKTRPSATVYTERLLPKKLFGVLTKRKESDWPRDKALDKWRGKLVYVAISNHPAHSFPGETDNFVDVYANDKYVGWIRAMDYDQHDSEWFGQGGGDLELTLSNGVTLGRSYASLRDTAVALALAEEHPPDGADRQAETPLMPQRGLGKKPNMYQMKYGPIYELHTTGKMGRGPWRPKTRGSANPPKKAKKKAKKKWPTSRLRWTKDGDEVISKVKVGGQTVTYRLIEERSGPVVWSGQAHDDYGAHPIPTDAPSSLKDVKANAVADYQYRKDDPLLFDLESPAGRIVRKSRAAWEAYVKKPSKTKLLIVARICDDMKQLNIEHVAEERKRCMRSVRAEAKARGWKLKK